MLLSEFISQLPPFQDLMMTETHLRVANKHKVSSTAGKTLFKLEDIYNIDERLEKTLKVLCRHKIGRVFDVNTFKSQNLIGTLQYWTDPKFVIDEAGAIRYYSGIYPFTYVSVESEFQESLRLTFVELDIQTEFLQDGSELHVVVDQTFAGANVSLTWLDTTYPGWRQRIEAAASLEMSPEESAKYVLEKVSCESSQDVRLPDVIEV